MDEEIMNACNAALQPNGLARHQIAFLARGRRPLYASVVGLKYALLTLMPKLRTVGTEEVLKGNELRLHYTSGSVCLPDEGSS